MLRQNYACWFEFHQKKDQDTSGLQFESGSQTELLACLIHVQAAVSLEKLV